MASPMAGYATYGVVLFAVLLLAGWRLARPRSASPWTGWTAPG
ncbi:hypothetical protein [Micromonospora fulviviridis]|uniref:Uncharacterized protein n=1 Tax=Micromonospora fulviviridis TaxID=47860 RepID=A0ABV2VU63_9ACTN